MHRKRNERPRSKKASPLAEPLTTHELPIPPSPPAFMLDDETLPVTTASDSAGEYRFGRVSPEPSASMTPPVPSPEIPEMPILQEDVSIEVDHPEKSIQVESSHTVVPVIADEPSMMENLARAVRSIYPPTGNSGATTSTGSKRRPLSIGSLIGSGFSRRRGSAGSLISTSLSPLLTPLNVGATRTHNLPEMTLEEDDRNPDLTPAEDEGDNILFASWFNLENNRNFLLLGYDSGFQIWDISALDSIQEVVNMKDTQPFSKPVFSAGIVTVDQPFQTHEQHILAYIMIGNKGTPDTELIAYSLTSHALLHRIHIPGALNLEANSRIIVVSSVKPPTLHLISPQTLQEVHTLTNVSSLVTYSLSTRLLAFSCPPPQEQERHLYSNPGVIARSPPQSITSLGGAIKVGQGLYTGMKALSGMAIAAASSARSSDPDTDVSTPGQWFSRSAPAASLSVAPSSNSNPASGARTPASRRLELAGRSPPMHAIADVDANTGIPHEGTWLTIIDTVTYAEVHRFRVSASTPVVKLHWSADGTSVYSCTSDGQTVNVYSVRPEPDSMLASHSKSLNSPSSPRLRPIGGNGSSRGSGTRHVHGGAPWHLYDLHRGHTSAKVLALATSRDNRWAVVGTHRGTLHIFATNPYGGPADISSHMQGKVHNTDTMQPLSTSLVPLVRVRPSSFVSHSEERDRTPMAVKFFTTEESYDLPPSIAPRASTRNGSTRHLDNARAFQDILVLHPATGTLELFRISLDVIEPQTTTSPPLRSRKDSPPRVGSDETVSTSLRAASTSALSRLMDRGQGRALHAKETSVATWNLRRGGDWAEVKHSLTIADQLMSDIKPPVLSRTDSTNWLSQVEITTFSRSPQVLPPPIYLSHQFSFHAFQEEYDALLRSHCYVIPTTPIKVRKEIEVKAEGDTFGNFSSMTYDREISTRKRPFDEPMANALNDSMDYSQSSPPTYPMLPNGPLRPSGLLGTLPVPIRKSKELAMGVGEGLGKLRGIVVGSAGTTGVRRREHEMEQDLEDEELLDPILADPDQYGDSLSAAASVSASHSGVSGSIHTPDDVSQGGGGKAMESTGIWDDWGDEERQVIDEVERFDEIYPAGMMDPEEDTPPAPRDQDSSPARPTSKPTFGGGGKRRKGGKKGAG